MDAEDAEGESASPLPPAPSSRGKRGGSPTAAVAERKLGASRRAEVPRLIQWATGASADASHRVHGPRVSHNCRSPGLATALQVVSSDVRSLALSVTATTASALTGQPGVVHRQLQLRYAGPPHERTGRERVHLRRRHPPACRHQHQRRVQRELRRQRQHGVPLDEHHACTELLQRQHWRRTTQLRQRGAAGLMAERAEQPDHDGE